VARTSTTSFSFQQPFPRHCTEQQPPSLHYSIHVSWPLTSSRIAQASIRNPLHLAVACRHHITHLCKARRSRRSSRRSGLWYRFRALCESRVEYCSPRDVESPLSLPRRKRPRGRSQTCTRTRKLFVGLPGPAPWLGGRLLYTGVRCGVSKSHMHIVIGLTIGRGRTYGAMLRIGSLAHVVQLTCYRTFASTNRKRGLRYLGSVAAGQ
jgi:hypothetical protein